MGDTSYGNAMTEIALALAMAFFSIMVLTMVSMGTPQAQTEPRADAGVPVKLTLAAPSPADAKPQSPKKKPEIIVFWNGRFYDKDLTPTAIAGRRFNGRVILALAPTLSMSEALAARSQVGARNLVVSTLDQRWLDTLKTKLGKE